MLSELLTSKTRELAFPPSRRMLSVGAVRPFSSSRDAGGGVKPSPGELPRGFQPNPPVGAGDERNAFRAFGHL